MSPSESWSFIKEQYKMVLCTLDELGLPHAAPVWYVVIDSKIYFRAQPYKKKISNLMKRSEIAAVVEAGDKYTELRGVMIRGLAKIVDTDMVLRKQVFELLAEKYRGLRDTDKFPKHWQERFGKEHRLVVELTPKSLVSWDNRKWLQRP